MQFVALDPTDHSTPLEPAFAELQPLLQGASLSSLPLKMPLPTAELRALQDTIEEADGPMRRKIEGRLE